jgi:hypothetical protein
MIKILLLLLAGGVATSYAEYKFSYNLYDTVKDKLVAVLKFLHLHK